jgi:hypothetical protein
MLSCSPKLRSPHTASMLQYPHHLTVRDLLEVLLPEPYAAHLLGRPGGAYGNGQDGAPRSLPAKGADRCSYRHAGCYTIAHQDHHFICYCRPKPLASEEPKTTLHLRPLLHRDSLDLLLRDHEPPDEASVEDQYPARYDSRRGRPRLTPSKLGSRATRTTSGASGARTLRVLVPRDGKIPFRA